jgi:hypothetical protein
MGKVIRAFSMRGREWDEGRGEFVGSEVPGGETWAVFRLGLIVTVIGLTIGFLAALAFPVSAQGQPGCAPLKMIEDVLRKSYKEERIGFGIVNETTVLLFYASPEGKTFSVLSLNPQGIACPIAGGTDLDLEAVRPGRAV